MATTPGLGRLRLCASALALLFALAACAPRTKWPEIPQADLEAEARKQKELVLREFLAMQERLQRVAWNLLLRNAELCGDRLAYGLGLQIATRDGFPKALQEGGAGADLHERPRVVFVAQGGPADLAGIRVGDMLQAVNGVDAGTRKEAREALEELQPGEQVSLAVKRDGEISEHLVTPVRVCGYPVRLKVEPVLNAYADGRQIVVYSEMLKFTRTDDELAVIVGHELAHNTQGHIRAKTVNLILGRLLVDLPAAVFGGVSTDLGGQLGRMVYSQEFENEADYVGLYYTARAGYDISTVAEVWRRMAFLDPKGISMGSTHPPTAQRFLALEAARDEIHAKQKAGRPLTPEMKQ